MNNEVYKDLEGGRVTPKGWEKAKTAKDAIERSIVMYRDKYGRGVRV